MKRGYYNIIYRVFIFIGIQQTAYDLLTRLQLHLALYVFHSNIRVYLQQHVRGHLALDSSQIIKMRLNICYHDQDTYANYLFRRPNLLGIGRTLAWS